MGLAVGLQCHLVASIIARATPSTLAETQHELLIRTVRCLFTSDRYCRKQVHSPPRLLLRRRLWLGSARPRRRPDSAEVVRPHYRRLPSPLPLPCPYTRPPHGLSEPRMCCMIALLNRIYARACRVSRMCSCAYRLQVPTVRAAARPVGDARRRGHPRPGDPQPRPVLVRNRTWRPCKLLCCTGWSGRWPAALLAEKHGHAPCGFLLCGACMIAELRCMQFCGTFSNNTAIVRMNVVTDTISQHRR